jgi:hypothetical protein
MNRRSQYDEDEDGRRILQDGERRRFPMWALDGLQREIAVHHPAAAAAAAPVVDVIETYSPAMVVDGFGNSGLALHQPGYRYLHAGHRSVDHAELVTAEAIRVQAREDYIRMTCDAWRGPGEGR